MTPCRLPHFYSDFLCLGNFRMPCFRTNGKIFFLFFILRSHYLQHQDSLLSYQKTSQLVEDKWCSALRLISRQNMISKEVRTRRSNTGSQILYLRKMRCTEPSISVFLYIYKSLKLPRPDAQLHFFHFLHCRPTQKRHFLPPSCSIRSLLTTCIPLLRLKLLQFLSFFLLFLLFLFASPLSLNHIVPSASLSRSFFFSSPSITSIWLPLSVISFRQHFNGILSMDIWFSFSSCLISELSLKGLKTNKMKKKKILR